MKAVEVDFVSSGFEDFPELEWKELPSMKNFPIYQGMVLRGNFSIHRQPGQSLVDAIAAIPEKERDALAAYFNNQDVQQNSEPTPSDVVIDFYEPLLMADLANADASQQQLWLGQQYPVLMKQLQTRSPHDLNQESIFEQRNKLSSAKDNDDDIKFWWLFKRPRVELRNAWSSLSEALTFGRVTKVWTPSVFPKFDNYLGLKACPTEAMIVFPYNHSTWFGIISSFCFEMIVRRQCSSMKRDLRFTPTEVFPFFPVPWEPEYKEGSWQIFPCTKNHLTDSIEMVSKNLLSVRENIFSSGRFRGPTDLYNHYDNPDNSDPVIQELRQAHIELHNAVLDSYGWGDLKSEWVFDRPWICKTNRFVPPAPIRKEILLRLAKLNHQRFESENARIKST